DVQLQMSSRRLALLRFFVRLAHPRLTDTSTLSLHDALPIWTTSGALDPEDERIENEAPSWLGDTGQAVGQAADKWLEDIENKFRSEEHTSELQSRENLVCRLLLDNTTEHVARILLTVIKYRG